MSVGCRADAEECRVETYFTYRAQHPRAGRSAKGLGSLELLVDFASGRPLIISESSRVLRQSQASEFAGGVKSPCHRQRRPNARSNCASRP
jgi:hypothetical protein